jgi:hypothetical protein
MRGEMERAMQVFKNTSSLPGSGLQDTEPVSPFHPSAHAPVLPDRAVLASIASRPHAGARRPNKRAAKIHTGASRP